MNVDDLVARLRRCGLEEKEAHAFVHLTRLGESKVTDLASTADLRRADAYAVLDRLQGRGLVDATLTRPRRYRAIDPERAVRILLEERERELDVVRGLQDDVVEGLARLGGGARDAGGAGGFRILHDRNQIRGQMTRTLRRAERDVALVTSLRGLTRLLDEGLDDEIAACRDRGVTVRVLTEILPDHADVVERLGDANVRHLLVPRPLRFILVDEREILQYVHADPPAGGKETALWIGAGDYVQAQLAFFTDLWKEAVTADRRLEQLRTGRTPEQARTVRGRFTRYEKMKEMILRAESTVDVLLTPADAHLLDKSGVGPLLAERAGAGVRVRLLHTSPDAPAVEGARVRAGDARLAGAGWVVVDGREVLLAYPAREAGDTLATPDEAATWVTMEGAAETFQHLFDAYWSDAE